MTAYEVRPNPAPLPVAADRSKAPYYVMIRPYYPNGGAHREKCATVYVKEGDFFRSQGGLTEEWGTFWTGINAVSLDDARLKAHASKGTACPSWHLEDRWQ